MATRCNFRCRRGILSDVMKIGGSLARNIDFAVANFPIGQARLFGAKWLIVIFGAIFSLIVNY